MQRGLRPGLLVRHDVDDTSMFAPDRSLVSSPPCCSARRRQLSMTGLADWAPNAHALVVHLPVGLPETARRHRVRGRAHGPAAAPPRAGRHARPPSTRRAGLPSSAAYLTRGAAPEVSPRASRCPSSQAFGAWRLVLVYSRADRGAGLAAGPRLRDPASEQDRRGGRPRERGVPPPARLAVAAVERLAGLVLLAATAELGGRLVYEYGVGVAAPLGQ